MLGGTTMNQQELWLYEVEPGVVIDTRPGAYQDEQGCDLSLVDAMMERTPRERLQALRGLATVAATRLDDEPDR